MIKTKKGISIFAIIALLLTGFATILVGCGKTDDNAKIEVADGNIKTEYYVGEELEFTGGMLSYINNKETTYVKLTKDMVSGFSTENIGSYSMIITYKGKTTKVDYKVLDEIKINLSKVYYCDALTSKAWVKFDQTNLKLYIYVGAPDASEEDEVRWNDATVATYTTAVKNHKQVIEVTVGDIKTELTPIDSNTFTMTSGSLTYTMTALGNLKIDLSRIYYCDALTSKAWVKFDEEKVYVYVASDATSADIEVNWSDASSAIYTTRFATTTKGNVQIIEAEIENMGNTISLRLIPVNATSFIMTNNETSYNMTAID